jgi:hypothetical protein
MTTGTLGLTCFLKRWHLKLGDLIVFGNHRLMVNLVASNRPPTKQNRDVYFSFSASPTVCHVIGFKKMLSVDEINSNLGINFDAF